MPTKDYVRKIIRELQGKKTWEENPLVTVTVQVVIMGITPLLGLADRLREAKMERLHPARRLHMRR